jgi:DNA-binding SARP family transcriptional activator
MPEIRVTLLGRFAVTVDGVPVAEAGWKRRHAAAVVKVLALAPGRRLHREQVIDLVWPGDTIAEAVPKLHKAAHFARRAIGVPASVVLRGDQVVLYPGGSVTVDAVQFGELARRALATGDAAAAREALALYGGELLPADRYEEWAETRREQLSQSHLDLLRLDGRWEAVAELDPGDERAHLALMRRHAANGDRHAALRQFDRLDRALRRELGLAPGPEASALRDRLLAAHDMFPAPRQPADRPRPGDLHCRTGGARRLGRSEPHADHQRRGRGGQVVAPSRHRGPGGGAGVPGRPRIRGPGRGSMAVCPGHGGA